jgi:hypothetical protein
VANLKDKSDMARDRAGWVTLAKYRVSHTTLAAVLVVPVDPARKDEHWIPRSQIMDGDTLTVGDTDIVVKSWIADCEGLD